MAEVLAANPEGQGSFYNSRKSSPASSSLFLDSTPLASSPRSTYTPPPPSDYTEDTERISPPISSFSASSRTSTTDLTSLLSQETTPSSSSLSLEAKYGQAQDFEDDFPQFGSYLQPASSESSDDQTASATTDTTASDSPLTTPTVADDTAIKHEPQQHVDYLSHDWREEDVWSSWRHIVSQRKIYGQQSRLENAAWRTWVKSKYHLPTVSPETLNWLKESDVTWLYGPLQCAPSHPLTEGDSKPDSGLSRSTSFVKKPILKKRSMSEVMLQRSISASSLLKQAAASVQAQGRVIKRSRSHERTRSAYVPGNSEIASRDQLDYFTSKNPSGDESPHEPRETRHIRFDDTVEQCIAVDCKPDDEEEEPEPEVKDHSSSGSSDEEGLVMKVKKNKRPGLRRKGSKQDGNGSRSNSHNGRKIIETLPSTTLKYRADTPEINEAEQQANKLPRSWSASKLSPSSSQETLRPARPSRNFLLGQDDEEDEGDTGDSGWSFGASNPKSSLGASASAETLAPPPGRRDSMAVHKARVAGGYAISRDSIDDDEDAMREARSAAGEDEPYGMEGLRRTESGMFMPYEEDEDDVMAAGLFGRISETVNTARDIAHVIWNVGWRQ